MRNTGDVMTVYHTLRQLIYELVDAVDLVQPIAGWQVRDGLELPQRQLLPGVKWPGERLETVSVDGGDDVPIAMAHTLTSIGVDGLLPAIDETREAIRDARMLREDLLRQHNEVLAASDFAAVATAAKLRENVLVETPSTPFRAGLDAYLPGDKIFLRTIAYYYVGRVVCILPREVVICEAAWVAEIAPQFHVSMATGECAGVEPYPRDWPITVARDTCSDSEPWPHPLFTATKKDE